MVTFKRDEVTQQAIKAFVKPDKSRPSSKKERGILRKVKAKLEKERKEKSIRVIRTKDKEGKIITRKVSRGEYLRMGIKRGTKRLFKQEGRKPIKKREAAVRGLLGATGIIPSSRYAGAGRPRGTFKYGMPIHVYKQKLRERKALYARYQQEQAMRLKPRGFSEEQIQQLQQQQTLREMQQPMPEQDDYEDTEDYQQMPQQYQQMPQMVQVKRKMPYGRILPRSQQIQPGRSIADEELDFRQWSAEQTISPRTQRILDRIRRIQNKAKSDNIEQQRRHRERMIVANQTNLLRAHENMIDATMDFTGVSEDNPLLAENIWKRKEDNNIMRTNRRNILDLQENNLKFF